MEKLFEKFIQKLQLVSTDFTRSIINEINWKTRLIGIKGARGIGKTTLLLQYIKLNHSNELEKTLYISLDSIWFSNNSLIDLVESFIKKGGKYLFLDEVHKYPNWSQEIKNMYDDYTDLQIVFTGSSLLEILNARADLSRRAIIYTMQGLSFREYIAIEKGINLPIINLDEILNNHINISQQILKEIKPFVHFDSYLKMGYYPFYKEEKELFNQRLNEVVNMILEIELPLLRNLEIAYIHRIKQLLVILTESVPFTPNITKISSKIGINRATLLTYLHYLEEAELTINLNNESGGLSKLQKPTKLYLNNPNLMYILQNDKVNIGTLREIFFANQLKYKHTLSLPKFGDFLIDNKYIIEIGGKDKSFKQIEGIENAYVAADDIEFGFGNKIPLWLFGFLY
jgi:predicted AAA+ superfamily ATPase